MGCAVENKDSKENVPQDWRLRPLCARAQLLRWTSSVVVGKEFGDASVVAEINLKVPLQQEGGVVTCIVPADELPAGLYELRLLRNRRYTCCICPFTVCLDMRPAFGVHFSKLSLGQCLN